MENFIKFWNNKIKTNLLYVVIIKNCRKILENELINNTSIIKDMNKHYVEKEQYLHIENPKTGVKKIKKCTNK